MLASPIAMAIPLLLLVLVLILLGCFVMWLLSLGAAPLEPRDVPASKTQTPKTDDENQSERQSASS